MPEGRITIRRCRLAGIQAVEAATAHAFARHTHDQFGIGVIHRGAQRSRSGRGMVEAGSGDTITVNPGEVHDGIPIGGGGRAWRMLYIAPEGAVRAGLDLTAGDPADSRFDRPVLRAPDVAGRFDRLFAAATAPDGSPGRLDLEQRLLDLLARVGSPQGAAAPAAAAPIHRARARIDDQPEAAVTLGELAAECGLSRFQVLRAFARETGLTPHAYLVQRRVDLARRLIARGTGLAAQQSAS